MMSALETVTSYLEAEMAGDLAESSKYYAASLVVHVAGDDPFAGEYSSLGDFLENYLNRFASLARNWTMVKRTVLFHGAEGVAILLHEEWDQENAGHIVKNRLCLYRVHDEKIVECWFTDATKAGK